MIRELLFCHHIARLENENKSAHIKKVYLTHMLATTIKFSVPTSSAGG